MEHFTTNETEPKKTIPCPKCKYIIRPGEKCPACAGTGKLTLKVIKKKKILTWQDKISQN